MKRFALALFAIVAFGILAVRAQQVLPPADTINCAYNTTPISVTNSQMVRVQCDPTGKLITSGGGGSSGQVQITDGTNGPVTVVPSNSAAVATGISLEMQLNPLSPGIISTGSYGSTPAATVVSTQTNDPCSGNIKSSAAVNITSATTTNLVPVSGATTVYVCGFVITISEVITTANTIVFEYGTGATCTSPTVLTGTIGAGGITAGAPITVTYGNGGATIFKSAASAGICALTAIGATGSFEGVLTYVQQ